MRSPAFGRARLVLPLLRCLAWCRWVWRAGRRAAGVAREDGADRRPPPWFRLRRRITQRGRARHAVLTYARRPLRFREGRFGHHPPTEAATQKYGRAKLTDYPCRRRHDLIQRTRYAKLHNAKLLKADERSSPWDSSRRRPSSTPHRRSGRLTGLCPTDSYSTTTGNTVSSIRFFGKGQFY